MQQVSEICQNTGHLQIVMEYCGLAQGKIDGADGKTVDDLMEALVQDENSLFFDVKVDELSRHRLHWRSKQQLLD